MNRQRDAIRIENEANEKQKDRQSSPVSAMRSDVARGYADLFDYISVLQNEIDRQDKEIENQYYKLTANEQKQLNRKREEEYRQRESALAGRIQNGADSVSPAQLPGNTLAGAIHAETEAAVGSSFAGRFDNGGESMAPSSVQHQKLTAAVAASVGPHRPVMRVAGRDAVPGAAYVPNNSRPVPDSGWQRANRNQPAQDMRTGTGNSWQSPAPAGNDTPTAGQPDNRVRQPQVQNRPDFAPAVPVRNPSVQHNGYAMPGGPYVSPEIPGGDSAGEQQFDDVPMPEFEDFASDSDDESDKVNSVVYTQMDLSSSVQGHAGGEQQNVNHHRRMINGREIRMPMDLLDQVQDSYTRDLVNAGVSMENMVVLNSGVREFGSSEDEWIIRLPKAMDGILDRRAPAEISAEISNGLGRNITVRFDFVDADVIEGCPDELDKMCYEKTLDEEYQNITVNPDFRKFGDILGLDLEHARIELVRPKTKGLS